jgi:adenylate kinase family enzyme
MITGDSGRGKTTFAEKLSKKLNIPWHSTDDYYYELKFSKPRDKQESVEMIKVLYQGDRWIIEGTTPRLLEPGLELAEIIIYLHFKTFLSQWFSIIKRSFTRKGDYKESWSGLFQLLKHVYYKKKGKYKDKKTQLEFISPHKNKLVMLESFKEMNDFINEFEIE